MSFEFVNIIRVKVEQFRKDLLYCIETIGRTLNGTTKDAQLEFRLARQSPCGNERQVWHRDLAKGKIQVL